MRYKLGNNEHFLITDDSGYTIDVNELASGSHTSSGITSMDGYVMAESGTPITSADTLNEAIGKVEKQHYEIVDFLEEKELVISASLNDLNERFDSITLKRITQAQYDALVNAGETDPNTLYVVTD